VRGDVYMGGTYIIYQPAIYLLSCRYYPEMQQEDLLTRTLAVIWQSVVQEGLDGCQNL
jgi:hypothetical protein